jgi:purine-binding chemotaxis protein CheW
MSVDGITEVSQYLTFILDAEIYAIKIAQVREVLDLTKITKVPRMPEFMRGVINLRGGVVPVVDLRRKFGVGVKEDTVDTCIIILEISVDDDVTMIGAISDSVKEVISLQPEEIEPAPKIGTRLNTEFIRGMSKRNDDFIILLDIARIFSVEELQIVSGPEIAPIGEHTDIEEIES